MDTKLKVILLKSASENLYGQVKVVRSKMRTKKIKQLNEYMKNSLIMDLFSFKVTFEERISGHVTERVNINKNAILKYCLDAKRYLFTSHSLLRSNGIMSMQ